MNGCRQKTLVRWFLSRIITGGSKHPQVDVFGGGFNYFPNDEFAAFVLSLPWQCQENVALLVNPENGPTKVFRPINP